MSEANEVAITMLPGYRTWLAQRASASTMDNACSYVTGQMPDETRTVIDNVAWCLYQHMRPIPRQLTPHEKGMLGQPLTDHKE